MAWPRVQAFEFNDHAATPAVLREIIIEALGRTLAWGRMLDGLVAPLEGFLEASGAQEVLDLGAGSGVPARVLLEALERAGRPLPHLLLTDLYPRVEAWARAQAQAPQGKLGFVAAPVDATAIPATLSSGRARLLLNVFHHFPPELARAILADAVAQRAPIFIAEGFVRDPLQFLNFAPAGLPALLLGPALAGEQRALKAWLTWCTPLPLLASVWDGVVSTLRVYTEAELRALVAPLGDSHVWTYQTYRFPPAGTAWCFYGVARG